MRWPFVPLQKRLDGLRDSPKWGPIFREQDRIRGGLKRLHRIKTRRGEPIDIMVLNLRERNASRIEHQAKGSWHLGAPAPKEVYGLTIHIAERPGYPMFLRGHGLGDDRPRLNRMYRALRRLKRLRLVYAPNPDLILLRLRQRNYRRVMQVEQFMHGFVTNKVYDMILEPLPE